METSFCRAFNLVTKFAFFRADVKKNILRLGEQAQATGRHLSLK